jgi:hypothetical protein
MNKKLAHAVIMIMLLSICQLTPLSLEELRKVEAFKKWESEQAKNKEGTKNMAWTIHRENSEYSIVNYYKNGADSTVKSKESQFELIASGKLDNRLFPSNFKRLEFPPGRIESFEFKKYTLFGGHSSPSDFNSSPFSYRLAFYYNMLYNFYENTNFSPVILNCDAENFKESVLVTDGYERVVSYQISYRDFYQAITTCILPDANNSDINDIQKKSITLKALALLIIRMEWELLTPSNGKSNPKILSFNQFGVEIEFDNVFFHDRWKRFFSGKTKESNTLKIYREFMRILRGLFVEKQFNEKVRSDFIDKLKNVKEAAEKSDPSEKNFIGFFSKLLTTSSDKEKVLKDYGISTEDINEEDVLGSERKRLILIV